MIVEKRQETLDDGADDDAGERTSPPADQSTMWYTGAFSISHSPESRS